MYFLSSTHSRFFAPINWKCTKNKSLQNNLNLLCSQNTDSSLRVGDNPRDAPLGFLLFWRYISLVFTMQVTVGSMTPFTDLRNERESQTPDTRNFKMFKCCMLDKQTASSLILFFWVKIGRERMWGARERLRPKGAQLVYERVGVSYES